MPGRQTANSEDHFQDNLGAGLHHGFPDHSA
jgi:hypothetical protein